MLADHRTLCVYFLPFGMAPVTEHRPEDTSVEIENNSSNKLRKVMVEKVRRDRINQSIEQLRTLLHPEGEQSDGRSSSRLEKADVLEIVVRFLRQKAMARAAPGYSHGFSQCLQESLRHLSLHARLKPEEREEIKRFYVHQRTALQRSASRTGTSKRSTPRSSPRTQGRLWRPW